MRGAVPRTCIVRGISGLGCTSLAAVIPILSRMGVQPAPLPAAALSTQTVGTQGLPPAASRPAWAPCWTTGSCPAGRPSASTRAAWPVRSRRTTRRGDWRRCWPRAAVPWRTRCLATAGRSFSPCPGRRLARCAGASASIGHRAEHAELCRDVPAARRALRILPRGAAPQGLPEGSRRPGPERPPARACRWRAANGAVPAWAPERRLLAIRPCLCQGTWAGAFPASRRSRSSRSRPRFRPRPDAPAAA